MATTARRRTAGDDGQLSNGHAVTAAILASQDRLADQFEAIAGKLDRTVDAIAQLAQSVAAQQVQVSSIQAQAAQFMPRTEVEALKNTRDARSDALQASIEQKLGMAEYTARHQALQREVDELVKRVDTGEKAFATYQNAQGRQAFQINQNVIGWLIGLAGALLYLFGGHLSFH